MATWKTKSRALFFLFEWFDSKRSPNLIIVYMWEDIDKA